MSKPVFYIGIDFGQRRDHTAVCIVEKDEAKAIVRFIWKYPLGTQLPMVADTVVDLFKSVAHKGDVYGFSCDATGMGVWPTQMIQERLPDQRIEPFVFNNTNKRELVGKVKVMHAMGRRRFATRKGDGIYNRQLAELMTEMRQLQAKVIRADADNAEIEVFKTGAHDDMFTALALAVKDIEFDSSWGNPQAVFIQDKTWEKNVLTEPSADARNIVFF